MQWDQWVVILGKSTTTGITEAIWTSIPKQKRFNGGDDGCVLLYYQGKESLLELFCIFPETCLLQRRGGGGKPDFSTKTTFLKMSPVQQELGFMRWLSLLKRRFQGIRMFRDGFLYWVGSWNLVCRESLSVLKILWFYGLLRIIACYYRGHSLIIGQLSKV